MLTVPTDDPTTGTYDTVDIARIVKSSTRHVRRMADSGQMPRPINVGRLVRWRRSTGNPMTGIDDWIAAGCPNCRPTQKAKGT